MRTFLTLLALFGCVVMGSSRVEAAEPTLCKSTVHGDLIVHSLKSTIFGNERKVRVLLPPGYGDLANKDRRYPVLYMLDGQNVFDACLSDVSHEEWGADEAAAGLISENKIAPLIIVGVDHAGKDRAREYLPYKDFVGNPDMDEPAGKQFPDFMTKEVMPLVNGQYRTLTGWNNTGIGGSSYGGVATLYALLTKPGVFGYGLIESPVLWVGMGQLVRDTDPLTAMPRRVFVAFGGREATGPGVNDKMIGLVRQLEANFHKAGYDQSSLQVVVDPEAEHTEAAWKKRLPDALTFLFGDWRPMPVSSN